ncbi:hypothetical protein KRP22_007041 [Phytophthora ramorum]|nr:hypothetical protein KRP22_1862 [Phytophthora ramorum]
MPVPQTYRAYQYDQYGPQAQELKLRLSVKRPELGPKQDLDEITTYLEKGAIVPVIDTVFEFEKLHAALTKLKGRHSRGKLVIKVNPESQA